MTPDAIGMIVGMIKTQDIIQVKEYKRPIGRIVAQVLQENVVTAFRHQYEKYQEGEVINRKDPERPPNEEGTIPVGLMDRSKKDIGYQEAGQHEKEVDARPAQVYRKRYSTKIMGD